MSKQYKVVEESQSAHCCFSATVVDTHNPVMIGGEHYNNQYDEICECFSVKEAELIAKALNQRAELLEALKEIITSVDKGQCVMLDKAREAITKAEAAE